MSTYEFGGDASIQPMAPCIKYLQFKNAFLFVKNEIHKLPFLKSLVLLVFSAVPGIPLVAVSETALCCRRGLLTALASLVAEHRLWAVWFQ